MIKPKRPRILWKAVVLALINVGILVGTYFYVRNYLVRNIEKIARKKIESLVVKASDSLYHLQFDGITADIEHFRLRLKNVRLVVDSPRLAMLERLHRRPPDIFRFTLKSLEVNGINVQDMLSGEKIDISEILLKEPLLEVSHKKTAYVKTGEQDTASLQTLYQRMSQQMKMISVKKISVQNMNVKYNNYVSRYEQGETRFRNVNLVLDDVLIDSLTQFDSSRFLYAKNANVSLGQLKLRTPDSLYFINIDSFTVNAVQKTMKIHRINMQPRGDRKEFSAKLPYAKERYDIVLNGISFKNIDWWNVVSDESFDAGEAVIDNAKIDIYMNRSLAANPVSKVGNYPSQVLSKLPLPVNISRLRLNNCALTYTEFNPVTGRAGTLDFTNMSADGHNITNDSAAIAHDPYMKISTSTRVLKTATLQATFVFSLSKLKEGVFTVDASSGPMDGQALNDVTEPLGNFRVKELAMKGLEAHLKGNNTSVSGSVKFAYDAIKLEIMKMDEGKQEKKGFLSFVFNHFIVRKQNPGNPERVFVQRDVHRSFFNLIWRAVEVGAVKAIGYEKALEKLK